MVDPVTTLTASAIATLAFQKFLETGAGELAKKFSTEAIAKMETLLKRIWVKLRGKPRVEEVKAAIDQTHKITPEQVNQIAAYLQVAMDEDPQFANDIRLLAQEINAGKLVDQSHMTQNIYDQAKGWQTKVEGGTAYIGEIHIQGKPD
ncbi:hypothetical protein [Leptodesmis sichuanensis]|uniref:hypothetical protein n=1 Tax=Leptodesmis sichuanensis TaxID=2906798 RepID=UPI001F397037|nr:hypothetical protein [Leptodesmis sichuanensis]UIE38396.1 hypothetical protein KIK02_01680 [Leptodesmis sichuanensis A121]